MLSLFTVKKILFFGTLGAGIFGPVIGTSPLIREFAWSSDVSPLKRGLHNLNLVDIYEGESISSFFKKSLLFKEGQEGLIESIAQELAKKWYFSQPSVWTARQQQVWKTLQEKQFKEAWEKLKPVNVQRDFWDNYWGSRENMNSFWLRHNSYKLVKEFLTEFNKSDFTLNSSFKNNGEEYKNSNDLSEVFVKTYSISETDLEKSENWNKIGFFPSASNAESQSNEWKKFVWGKYEFINWCYKYWFNKNLPTYFWKISWFYNKNATSTELAQEYNKDFLKENFPEKTHYGFPVFPPSTNKKFQEFIKKIANVQENGAGGDSTNGNNQDLQLEKYYIEGWNGDQAHPATLLEVLNSFETVSPEYASASTYLINKVIEDTNGTTDAQTTGVGTDSNSKKINELKLNNWKNGDNGNGQDKNPISIFFNDENGATVQGTETQNNNRSITFDSQILKKNGSPNSKKHIYDLRETDSGNWIFFRDDQGIHAITLDGHLYLNGRNKQNNNSAKDSKEKLRYWFNFRNLQSNGSRRHLSSKKSIQVSEDWFASFKDYFSKNFDRLLTEYYLKEGEKSLLFYLLKDKNYFNNFKDILTNLFALIESNELNSKLFNLRKKIIEKYSSREWTLKDNSGKEPQSIPAQGLVSPFPYEINLTSDDNKGRFPSQENVFNKFLKSESKLVLGAPVAVQASAEPTKPKEESEHTKLFTKYFNSVNSLIDNKKINLSIRSNGFDFQSSQRLFIVDSIFDYLLDKLFGNKDLLNYLIKEKKLLNSNLFENNELLKEKGGRREKENLPWNAPINAEIKLDELLLSQSPAVTKVSAEAKPNSNQENQCWDCTSSVSTDSEKNKESRRSLLNSLLKIYFFRSYLTKLNHHYFGFLGDFPEIKKSENQQTDQIQTNQGTTTRFSFLASDLFEHWRKSYLQDIKERDNFLNFLITLNFLSKNNFEQLKKALQTELSSTTKYHYLFFEPVSEKKNEGDKKEIHPFLSSEKSNGNNGFFANRDESGKFLRESWKTHGTLSLEESKNGGSTGQTTTTNPSRKKEAMFKELFTEHSSLPNKKDNLFNFSNLKELLNAIKNMTSHSEFEKLVILLSKVHKSIRSEFYKLEKVYLHNHQEKKIFLDEKKRLLIYQLLNTDKGPFYSSKSFTSQDETDIFKKSIDELIKGFNGQKIENGKSLPTTTSTKTSNSQTQTNNTAKHLEEKHFKREMGELDGGYFIQVSAQDFKDEAGICRFFNLLPINLLADFLMIQTDKPLNKENAQNNFFDSTYRLKPRDMKFKNHINSRHLE